MARKEKETPIEKSTPTEAEIAADAVRAARQAKRDAKKAAADARAAVAKPAMGKHGKGGKNAFGIAASSSKVTAVSRSIISRSRGGRGR